MEVLRPLFCAKKGRFWKCSLFTPPAPHLPAYPSSSQRFSWTQQSSLWSPWRCSKLDEKSLVPMLCISRRASLLAVGLLNLTLCCVGLAACTSWFILRHNLRTVGGDLTWLVPGKKLGTVGDDDTFSQAWWVGRKTQLGKYCICCWKTDLEYTTIKDEWEWAEDCPDSQIPTPIQI